MMKTYTGTATCKSCNKEFSWEYVDDGYRQGMVEYISPVVPISHNTSIAQCRREVITPKQNELLVSNCPHCQADVAIPCSESIMKELYEQLRQ